MQLGKTGRWAGIALLCLLVGPLTIAAQGKVFLLCPPSAKDCGGTVASEMGFTQSLVSEASLYDQGRSTRYNVGGNKVSGDIKQISSSDISRGDNDTLIIGGETVTREVLPTHRSVLGDIHSLYHFWQMLANHSDGWTTSNVVIEDTERERFSKLRLLVGINFSRGYPSSLRSRQSISQSFISLVEFAPLKGRCDAQQDGCDSQTGSPANKGAGKIDYRSVGYVIVGLLLIICGYFTALGEAYCSVFWANRRGRSLICAALLTASILFVCQGIALICVGLNAT